MNRFLYTCTLSLIAAFTVNAQSLYMPRNIEEAYKNGTRASNGLPGSKYWQNKGRYNITVTATRPTVPLKAPKTSAISITARTP